MRDWKLLNNSPWPFSFEVDCGKFIYGAVNFMFENFCHAIIAYYSFCFVQHQASIWLAIFFSYYNSSADRFFRLLLCALFHLSLNWVFLKDSKFGSVWFEITFIPFITLWWTGISFYGIRLAYYLLEKL